MIFFAAIIFNTLSSVSIANVCDVEEKYLKVKINLGEDVPEYFFKAIMPQDKDDKRNEATLIVDRVGNVLMDLNTGSIKKIPGPYDAVPSIDGKIMTIPSNKENDYNFTIFSRNDLTKPLYEEKGDDALRGVYQSVGLVNKDSSGKTIYRVITDRLTNFYPSAQEVETQQGPYELPTGVDIYYKDYAVVGSGKDMKISSETVGGRKSLCPNISTSLKLPMLSKDGKMVAAYNNETGTTNIFKVTFSKSGESTCSLEKDLGFASTKVEFSPDSSKIVFAADSLSTKTSNVTWYRQPKIKEMNMNIYVMDLKTNELTKISNNTSGSSYYPTFSRDGTVTYLNQEKENDKIMYSLVQAEIPQSAAVKSIGAEEFQFDSCVYKKEDLSLTAIGKLWYSVCSKFEGTPTVLGSKFVALSMEPEKCQELVKNYWKEKREIMDHNFVAAKDVGAYKTLTANDLVASTNFANFVSIQVPANNNVNASCLL